MSPMLFGSANGRVSLGAEVTGADSLVSDITTISVDIGLASTESARGWNEPHRRSGLTGLSTQSMPFILVHSGPVPRPNLQNQLLPNLGQSQPTESSGKKNQNSEMERDFVRTPLTPSRQLEEPHAMIEG